MKLAVTGSCADEASVMRCCLSPHEGADGDAVHDSTAPGRLIRPWANFGYAGGSTTSSTRVVRRAGHPDSDAGGAMGPNDELLGVVVHSGLVLCRRKDVVAAVRRITAFPTGLVLDTVVLATALQAT